MVSTSAWLAFLASSTSTVALSAFKAKASLFSLIPLLASSKESNKPGFWSSPFKLLAKSETFCLILLTSSLSAFLSKAALFSLIPLLASSKASNKPGFWSSPFKLLAKSETSVLILLIFSSFLLIALAISSSELFVDILLPSATE